MMATRLTEFQLPGPAQRAKAPQKKSGKLMVIRSLGAALGISTILLLTSLNPVGVAEFLASLALLFIAWWSYSDWRSKRQSNLPFFAMIAFMYWLFYGVQLFWGELVVPENYQPKQVDPDRVRDAMFMALLGVGAVWLGVRTRLGIALVPKGSRTVRLKPSSLNYVRGVLIVGTVANGFQPSFSFLGEGLRQPVAILLTTVPLLAFAILFRRVLRGEAQPVDKLLVGAFLVIRTVSGLSSGWLGSFASIIILCGGIYAVERHRLPRVAVVCVVVCILFFQIGKQDFRRTYWAPDQPVAEGQVERVGFWVKSSFDRWADALTDPTGEGLAENLSFTMARMSLLPQTADVIDKTPSHVPYQNGRLYSYLLYTWIPRAIWPDKPSMSEANQYYQVAYGVTEEEYLDRVSIAIGVLTEAYINFGWIGVVVIMFMLGIFFDFYSRFFFAESSGLVLSSLGIVLLPQMLAIESQMAQYVGGLVQQTLLSLLVMLPAISVRRIPTLIRRPVFQYSR
jgi:hypothetical protein